MEFGMLPDKVYQLSLFKIYTRWLALPWNKYGAWNFLDGVGGGYSGGVPTYPIYSLPYAMPYTL